MSATRLGELVRAARKRAGLRLEDVAERVGVTAGAMSHIESGRRLPSPHNAVRIADVLGIPVEDLLMELDHEHSSRRRGSIDSLHVSAENPRPPGPVYSAQPIEALFQGSRAEVDAINLSRRAASPSPAPGLRSARTTARWSEDTAERISALDELATTASEAIRTLRGLLGDDDPTVAHEAARLLRELQVRGPEE